MKLHKFLALLLLSTFFLVRPNALLAQSVGINTSGSAPDPSAMLDVSASDKGVLIPRVQLDDASTAAPISAAPVEGLLIYNAAGTEPSGYYYWDGAQWVQVATGAKAINSALVLNGNTLELTDPGGTLTADLAALNDSTDNDSVVGNELINSVTLNASNELVIDEAGTSFVQDLSSLIDDADPDPTNEYNTGLALSNDTLKLTDNGGTLTQDLSSLGGGGGHWSRDASDEELYPSKISDSVGIGMQNPRAELHIKGKDVDITNNTAALKIWEQKDGDSLYMDGDEITGGLGGGAGNENALYLQHEASEHVVMSTGSGYVGIGSGANYPSYKLHVQESSTAELARIRNMSTGNLNATGIYAMAKESDGQGVGGEFEGGRQGVHGYVTTNATDFAGQELAGVKGRSIEGTTDGVNVGLKGRAYNSEDRNYAVHGYCLGQDAGDIGSDPTDYAIFGDLNRSGRNTTWAGYFNGDVEVTGNFINPSDRSLKTDIKAEKAAMDRLDELKVYSYRFEDQEYMNLPQGKQFGFVAQEVEEVLPRLVHESVFSTSRPGTDEAIPKKEYKSLDYLGFIPLLTKGLQEQKATIEGQKERIRELEQEVESNEAEIEKLRSELGELKKAVEAGEE